MKTREQVKSLWRLCFNDTEAFIEMYFRLRYNKDVNIAIQSGEEVIAALQMLPYPMTFCGEQVPVSYVSGACTHPDFRSRGVMRELLSQAFATMYRNDVLFSALIPAEPWLFDYYARSGYASVFRRREQPFPVYTLTSKSVTDISVEQTTDYQEEVYLYLADRLAQRPCCLQHTVTDFKVILEDLAMTGDALFVARRNKRVVGVAVAYRYGTHTVVNELLADDDSVKKELLHQVRMADESETLTLFLPAEAAGEGKLLGMARIINARRVLQLYAAAHPEETWNIELTDEQLSVNNGYYYIYKGSCHTNDKRLPGAHISLTIAELSEKILGPMKPYMSLMMN